MEKEDIRVKRVIVHILDSEVGMPVLSDAEVEHGSDFSDFLREHIYKLLSGDDVKRCSFIREESEIFRLLTDFSEEDFIGFSREAASRLYEIMNANIDIPPADFVVCLFEEGGRQYLALLKMNFKASYTHRTVPLEGGNMNDIIRYKSILPSETQRLKEAAAVCLSDYSIWLAERKYEVNGEKTDYFSSLFLQCRGRLSHKDKLSIVTRAVEKVQSDFFDETERFEQGMKAKSIISRELSENGGFVVSGLAEEIFEDAPQMRDSFHEKIEKYHLRDEEIAPRNDATMRRYQKQYLSTDTGIEIRIPMDQYNSPGKVEFITNENGTISVLIKDIGRLVSR